MTETINYLRAVAELKRAKSVVLTTHVKPDGDALGSVAALRRWLTACGKAVTVVVPSPPPVKYGFLDPDGVFQVAGRDVNVAAIDPPDLVCVLDTCTWLQLTGMEPLVRDSSAPVLAIDHHRTQDALADFLLVDPNAAATAVLIHRLLREAGAMIDAPTATYLLAALAVDTDWFRLPNVDASVLRLAADLVEAGAQPHEIYDALYLSDDLVRLHLRGRAIEALRPVLDGRAVVMRLPRALFRELGADIGDTENLINECLRLRGSQVAVLLVEADADMVRISLRSRPPVNVLKVAQQFGGGGHIRASGARFKGSLDRAEAAVLAAVADALAEADGVADGPKKA